MSWKNWSGRVTASPSKIVPVATEADVVTAIKEAADAGRRIRAVGAGHSHSPLVATDATLIDPTAMSGVVGIDPTRCEALVLAGTRISDLGRPLRDAGFALKNQGDIDRRAIAGAVATGTHGTGTTSRIFLLPYLPCGSSWRAATSWIAMQPTNPTSSKSPALRSAR